MVFIFWFLKDSFKGQADGWEIYRMETCGSNGDTEVCVEGVVCLGFLLAKLSFCLTAIYTIYAAGMPVHLFVWTLPFQQRTEKIATLILGASQQLWGITRGAISNLKTQRQTTEEKHSSVQQAALAPFSGSFRGDVDVCWRPSRPQVVFQEHWGLCWPFGSGDLPGRGSLSPRCEGCGRGQQWQHSCPRVPSPESVLIRSRCPQGLAHPGLCPLLRAGRTQSGATDPCLAFWAQQPALWPYRNSADPAPAGGNWVIGQGWSLPWGAPCVPGDPAPTEHGFHWESAQTPPHVCMYLLYGCPTRFPC